MRRFLPEEAYCAVISSFHLSRGVTYEQRRGFVIYAGQAGLYYSIFRIANMGAIGDSDLERLLGVSARASEQPRRGRATERRSVIAYLMS